LARTVGMLGAPSRPRRRSGRSRWVSRVSLRVLSVAGATALLTALLPAIASQAAQATTIAQAQAQLDALSDQAEAASEAYNGAQESLTLAQHAASAATAAAVSAHTAVVAEQNQVGVLAAESYTSGGLSQGLAVVLSTSDPSEAMNRIAMLQQLSNEQAAILATAKTDDLRYQQSVAAAAQATATATQLSANLAQKQAAINAALAKSQQVLATLTAAQRIQLLAAQKAKLAAEQAQSAIALADYRRTQATQAAQAAVRQAANAAAAHAQVVQAALPQSARGSSVADKAVAAAMTRLGDRYVFGATGPRRFDCSGLVQWAYGRAGVSTAHYTGDFWRSYRHVSYNQLKPGDLVFFYRDHHHVGIYIGNGLMINAPHTGDVVRIASVLGHGSFSGAVRVVG
jgi:peptidoglycan DL-endopeptidase CwlO